MKVRWHNIGLLLMILLVVWIVASFVDVNIHNDICNSNYGEFAKLNLFTLLF